MPKENQSFSKILVDFVPQLAKAIYNVPFEKLDLPSELRSAMILHQGQLTDNYQYLKQYL